MSDQVSDAYEDDDELCFDPRDELPEDIDPYGVMSAEAATPAAGTPTPDSLDHLIDNVWDELNQATNHGTEPYTYVHVANAVRGALASLDDGHCSTCGRPLDANLRAVLAPNTVTPDEARDLLSRPTEGGTS